MKLFMTILLSLLAGGSNAQDTDYYGPINDHIKIRGNFTRADTLVSVGIADIPSFDSAISSRVPIRIQVAQFWATPTYKNWYDPILKWIGWTDAKSKMEWIFVRIFWIVVIFSGATFFYRLKGTRDSEIE